MENSASFSQTHTSTTTKTLFIFTKCCPNSGGNYIGLRKCLWYILQSYEYTPGCAVGKQDHSSLQNTNKLLIYIGFDI